MVVIRLARHGSKKKPFYKIMVADKRFACNGRFIEKVGFFNPLINKSSKKLYINIERISYWIKNGALMSDRVKSLIKINKDIRNVKHI
ncbi:30S ribosomal protein S16 [Buchnera aphidicola (Taiwanaphis decaspermi)]|uniref:30S ribosomal protein S16 n=1 Tax=Buchnera aphidicola TaxID=9 RepID=UPI0031B8826E